MGLYPCCMLGWSCVLVLEMCMFLMSLCRGVCACVCVCVHNRSCICVWICLWGVRDSCICMCVHVCMCRTHLYPFSASTLQVISSLKSMMCSFFCSFHGHSIAENSDEDHSRNGDRNGEAGQAAGLTKVQKETILGREGGSKSKYCQHKRKTNYPC